MSNKGLLSQVVKPGSESKGGKSVYSQAISDVKEGGRRKHSLNRNNNKYDNYEENNNYNMRNNYRNNRGGKQNQRNNRQMNNNDNRTQESVNVTGRNLIIKRRARNTNSRSRSRSLERDLSKERERKNSFNNNQQNNNYNNQINPNEQGDDFNQNHNNQAYNKRRYNNQHQNQHQKFVDPNYYSQNNMQMQMLNQGFFNPRRLAPNPYMGGMGRGRFPTRFVKSRYLGSQTR